MVASLDVGALEFIVKMLLYLMLAGLQKY